MALEIIIYIIGVCILLAALAYVLYPLDELKLPLNIRELLDQIRKLGVRVHIRIGTKGIYSVMEKFEGRYVVLFASKDMGAVKQFLRDLLIVETEIQSELDEHGEVFEYE